MPRATTKEELLAAADEQFSKLWKLVDSMTEAQQTAPFDFGSVANLKESHWDRDKNLRDVLVHLYEWHQLLLKFVSDNRAGDGSGAPIPFLPAPYTWKTYGDMNVGFWEKHQNTSYAESQKMVRKAMQR